MEPLDDSLESGCLETWEVVQPFDDGFKGRLTFRGICRWSVVKRTYHCFLEILAGGLAGDDIFTISISRTPRKNTLSKSEGVTQKRKVKGLSSIF